MQDQQIPDRLRVTAPESAFGGDTEVADELFGNPEPAQGSLEPVGEVD